MLAIWVLLHAVLGGGVPPPVVQEPAFEVLVPVDARELQFPRDATIRPSEATIRRSRPVHVMTELFAPAEIGRIELFDGASVAVRFATPELHGVDRSVWTAHVVGVEAGFACFAVRGETVTGSVRLGTELYSLRTARSGVHVLSEIDQTRFPPCATSEENVVTIDEAESQRPSPPSQDAEPYSRDAQPSPSSTASVSAPIVIDVLVVYTPQAKDAEGGTAAIEALIDLAVAETNQAYEASQVQQRLRLVHTEELVGYTEVGIFGTELGRLTNPSDGWFDGVHAVRDQYGADVVAMIIANTGSCGVSWQMGRITPSFDVYAFSVTSRLCATGYYTFGHEIGHNMGCWHDRDTLTTTLRMSVTAAGGEVHGSSSVPRISGSSYQVAIYSEASDLVPGDTNGVGDVFVVSRIGAAPILASKSTSGVLGNAISWWPVISFDGRWVAFQSEADNLVAGDSNGVSDVFVHDTQTGTTQRVSVSTTGAEAHGASGFASISNDGRYVAFESDADDLVLGDTNGARDVFVRDLQLGTTVRASVNALGIEADGPSNLASISGDGKWVAFQSAATNLVPADGNGVYDVFVHGLASGATIRASVDASSVEGDQGSGRPSISLDGRYVAFESWATNLEPGDVNGLCDVFVRDVSLGTTHRVSLGAGGAPPDGISSAESIASNGSAVAFESEATNLVDGDTNGTTDVFVHDLGTGVLRRTSVSSSGRQANAISSAASLSADGRFVAFLSNASNLVPGDANFATDIFTHDRSPLSIGSFPYSYGYRTPSDAWRTIMAYPPGTRLPYFSNPNVSFQGEALGIADPDPFSAENWKTLNASAATVAGWRSSSTASYCFGDGFDAAVTAVCPCDNFGAPGRGCANSNSALAGALLLVDGSVQPNTLALTCVGVPNLTLCTFLRGTASDDAGAVFGDGVKCASGILSRFAQQVSGQGGNPGNSASAGVASVPAGNVRYYQCQYRNPSAGFCPPALFNVSSGVRISW